MEAVGKHRLASDGRELVNLPESGAVKLENSGVDCVEMSRMKERALARKFVELRNGVAVGHQPGAK